MWGYFMNSMQLKDKLKNISKEKDVDFNTLLRFYMYDRFIERLAVSKYKNNFILKGGFYLSTLFGVESRTTMDIDTAFRNANFNEETLSKMMNEIISIDLNDNVKLDYLGISNIRDEDEYGGYRISIQVELENVKEKFHIDVATGDLITPKEIIYKYKPILSDNYIKLWAYNMETVLAEKLETIFSRAELNSRMRDYYDIYLIYMRNWENINLEHFNNAITNTFSNREYSGNLYQTVSIIKNSKILKDRWENYQKKYSYCNNISFDEIMKCIDNIVKHIELDKN